MRAIVTVVRTNIPLNFITPSDAHCPHWPGPAPRQHLHPHRFGTVPEDCLPSHLETS